MMRQFLYWMVATIMLAAGASADLASAALVSVSGQNTSGNAAVWTVEGHISYTVTLQPPPSPPGWKQYNFPIHRKEDCGTDYCDLGPGAQAYYKIKCTSGAGVFGDGITVNIKYDSRVYYGSNNYFAHYGGNGSIRGFIVDNEFFEDDWGPGNGLVTNEAVQYKIGTWQSGNWVANTATPFL